MKIRRALSSDREALVDIWLRSVRATHTFLSEEEIQELLPLVDAYLSAEHAELWVLCTDSGTRVGFMGMADHHMESLFLAPEFHGRGGGRRLVAHARSLHGELTVDVNEQNDGARGFYRACGFRVEGRSEVDRNGRPHPILHLRLPADG